LIKEGWINSVIIHTLSNGPVNALEREGPMSLKVSLDKVYKILIEARYKKGRSENGSTSRNFISIGIKNSI
jgi:hypothetical protein